MKNWIAGLCALLMALAMAVPASAGDWKKAETRHAVIYSDGSTSQLETFSEEVEKFDSLLRMVFSVPEPEVPSRLTIYLLSGPDDVARLYGNSRSGVAGFYVPRLEGSVAISNRQYTRSDRLDGQRTLFHEYAHHFMLNSFPRALPSWLVEGFAEFVSTAEFKRDGSWTFGGIPEDRGYEIFNLRDIPIEALLTERVTKENRNQMQSFYGWSWALTHMLFLGGDGDGAINKYLDLLNAGTEPLDAARQAFGDLDKLERNLRRYVRGQVNGVRSDKPVAFDDDIRVAQLSETNGELRKLIMLRRVGTRLQPLEETRDELARLAPRANTAEAWYQLARADYSLAEDAETPDWSAARAATERALAIDAKHVRANVLMGRILANLAADGASDDPDIWNRALAYIARGNQADPYDPVPLFYFAQTELREGRPSASTNGALARAFSIVRESPDARIAYAFDLARIGDFDSAIALMQVLANDPHGGEQGREMIEKLEEMRDSGDNAAIQFTPIAQDEDDMDDDIGDAPE